MDNIESRLVTVEVKLDALIEKVETMRTDLRQNGVENAHLIAGNYDKLIVKFDEFRALTERVTRIEERTTHRSNLSIALAAALPVLVIGLGKLLGWV